MFPRVYWKFALKSEYFQETWIRDILTDFYLLIIFLSFLFIWKYDILLLSIDFWCLQSFIYSENAWKNTINTNRIIYRLFPIHDKEQTKKNHHIQNQKLIDRFRILRRNSGRFVKLRFVWNCIELLVIRPRYYDVIEFTPLGHIVHSML